MRSTQNRTLFAVLTANAFLFVIVVFWFGENNGSDKIQLPADMGVPQSVTLMEDVSEVPKKGDTDSEPWWKSKEGFANASEKANAEPDVLTHSMEDFSKQTVQIEIQEDHQSSSMEDFSSGTEKFLDDPDPLTHSMEDFSSGTEKFVDDLPPLTMEDFEREINKFEVDPDIQTNFMEGSSRETKMENTDLELWKNSETWRTYLTKLKTSGEYFLDKKNTPIINDDNYCTKRLDYLENRVIQYTDEGLPIRRHKNIYVQFRFANAMTNTAVRMANVYNVHDQISKVKGDISPVRIPVEADVVWGLTTDFYYEHEIGKHYVCHNQRASYIPGAKKMKMKDDLALMMKAYSKNFVGREHCFNYEDYMPKTYVMIDEEDCHEALDVLTKELGNQTKIKWLGKIARDSHKGLGITIMTEEAIQNLLEEYDYGAKCKEKSTNQKESYLIQWFIQNPYLVKGRKFDFRVFLTIVSLDPFMVLYHDGFVKIAFDEWDEDSSDWNALIASLTATQEAQKGKGKSKEEVLSEVKWSLEQFEEHLVEEGKVEKGWVKNYLQPTMRKAMLHLMRFTSHDFLKHPELFGYFGVDFLLDDDLHMWFLEIVDQPGLFSKTPEMERVTFETFSNLLDMQIALNQDNWELFDKIVDRSEYQWVIDERKSGVDRYHGLLEPECVQIQDIYDMGYRDFIPLKENAAEETDKDDDDQAPQKNSMEDDFAPSEMANTAPQTQRNTVSGGMKIRNTDPELWRNSQTWRTYLTKLKTSGEHFLDVKNFPIINDDDYCAKRAEYLENRVISRYEDGMPIRRHKNIYVQFRGFNAMTNTAEQISNVYDVHDQIVDDKRVISLIKIPVEADVIWGLTTDFYYEHEIGKHYLCNNQRASYIPGAKKMKMKDDLALMMKAYSKNFVGREHCFNYEDYMPKTYVMIDEEDCQEALDVLEQELGHQTKIKWLGKIARDSHKGLGITIMTEDAIENLLEEYDYGAKCKEKSTSQADSYLIQWFIQNPYLVKGRKFDFRVFLTIVSLDPFMVLYHDGFVKIAFDEWDEDSSDWNALIASLTATQEAQKGKGMSKEEVLSEVKWSLEQFEEHLVEEGKVEKGWVRNYLQPTMRKAMLHLMRFTSHDFLKHPDLFGYFGVDFLLDDDLHMWFLEIVDQPGMFSKTPEMERVTYETFSNLLDMQIALNEDNWELFDKIVERSEYQWVIDERKSGVDRYHGLLEPECVQIQNIYDMGYRDFVPLTLPNNPQPSQPSMERAPPTLPYNVQPQQNSMEGAFGATTNYNNAPELWKNSEAWSNYLTQLKNKTGLEHFLGKQNLPYVNDDYYCEKRLEYVQNRVMQFDMDGLPIKRHRNIYTAFRHPNAMTRTADAIGNWFDANHQIIKHQVSPIRIPVEADVIWGLGTDFYFEHEIGKHYLCHNQRASYIPGAKKMKMKDDLALMMKDYSKKFIGREHCFNYEDYMPKTYVMIDEEDCHEALDVLEKEIGNQTSIKWLGKIARDSHKGEGITIMTEEAIQHLLQEYDYGAKCKEKSTNQAESYLIQWFIPNPYLVKGRKFDFRVFLTIVSLDPFIVLYHDGFVKIAFEEWDADSSDWNTLIASLTATQEHQKGSGMSNLEVLAEVKWSLGQFEEHLIEEGKVEKGWVKNYLQPEMRKAMLHLMRFTSHDFLKHPNLFGYFGVDFLLDDDLHMWFLEIVDQPGMLSKTQEMERVTKETFSNLLNMQVALNQDNWELFDKIVEQSEYQWVIDERKSGIDKYAGLLEPECVVV